MPQTSDPSPKTLPLRELNPLLNPLLAENMNRWAEVYFNNPPERREQAVLALLRELEAQHALREAATLGPRATFHSATDVPAAARESASELTQSTPLLRCGRCGRENPVTHKFCGMCGETLHPERATEIQTVLPAFVDEERREASRTEAPFETELESEPSSSRYQERSESPAGSMSELSLFQNVRREDESYDDEDAAYESTHSHSYRIYIGAVLAIVLLALGYTAWRASENSRTSDEPSPALPVAAKEAPTPAPPTAAPANANAMIPAPAATTAEKQVLPSHKSPSASETTTAGNKADAGVANSAKAESGYPNQPSTSGGNEELAQAERYLDGADGRARDTAAAAPWLWKSIAKHNGRATLLLADLYLKGDGVSKNCDQAHMLLDSAARKGVAGAGERLRNLQAFGCQ